MPRILAYDRPLMQLHNEYDKHQPGPARVWRRLPDGVGDLCQCSCGLWLFRGGSPGWKAMSGYLSARSQLAKHPKLRSCLEEYYRSILPDLPAKKLGINAKSTWAELLGENPG